VIAHTDPINHTVDLNARLLAPMLGMTEESLEAAIGELCSPDPKSRTPDKEGRRLEKLSTFKFLVVTHEKYLFANDRERRKAMRLFQRQSRDRQKLAQAVAAAGKQENNGSLTGDASIPTWEEVKTAADMSAVPEAIAKNFFDYHQGNNLWLNKFQKLIDWRHKLVTWSAKDRVATPGTTSRYGIVPQHIQLRAIQQEIEKHVANPDSVFYKPDCTDLEKSAYKALKKRRDGINREIAAAAVNQQEQQQQPQV